MVDDRWQQTLVLSLISDAQKSQNVLSFAVRSSFDSSFNILMFEHRTNCSCGNSFPTLFPPSPKRKWKWNTKCCVKLTIFTLILVFTILMRKFDGAIEPLRCGCVRAKWKCIFEFEIVAQCSATCNKIENLFTFVRGRRWLSEIKIRMRAFAVCCVRASKTTLN